MPSCGGACRQRAGDPQAARHPDPQGRRARRREGPAGRARRPLGAGRQPGGADRSSRCRASDAGRNRPAHAPAPATRPDLGGAALLDPHAGLRDPARRAAQDAALGARPELRRLGAVPGRRRLPGSRTCARSSTAAAPRTRASGSSTARSTAASSPPPTTRCAMARRRVRRPARPRRRAAPRRPRPRRRGDRAHPRGRLRLHRRGQDRPARAATPSPFFKPDWSPERMRTQMYTCHLSVLRRSLVEEVGGFDAEFEGSQDWDLVLRVTERARAVVHVPRVLYHWRTAGDLGRRRPRPPSRGPSRPGRRAVQAHCERIGLPAEVEMRRGRPRRAAPASRGSTSSRWSASSSRPAARCATSASSRSCSSSTACAASSSARPTRTTRSSAWSTTRADAGRARRSCARSPASACAWSAYDGRVRLLRQDQPRRRAQRGRAPAAAQRRHRGDDAGMDRADGDVLASATGSAPSAAGCSGATPASSTSASASKAACPATSTTASPATTRGYMNAVLIARNCLAVTGACLMTRRDVFERAGRADAASSRSTSTTSTTASRLHVERAARSSTTPT